MQKVGNRLAFERKLQYVEKTNKNAETPAIFICVGAGASSRGIGPRAMQRWACKRFNRRCDSSKLGNGTPPGRYMTLWKAFKSAVAGLTLVSRPAQGHSCVARRLAVRFVVSGRLAASTAGDFGQILPFLNFSDFSVLVWLSFNFV